MTLILGVDHNKSLEALSFSIGTHLKNLRKLALEFCNCDDVNNDVLKHIGLGLCRKLKDLQVFCIVFRNGIAFTDIGLILLSKYITRNLRNLQALTFDLYDNSGDFEISDEIIDHIVDDFAENLKSLKELKLNFGMQDNILLKQRIRVKLSYIEKLDLC